MAGCYLVPMKLSLLQAEQDHFPHWQKKNHENVSEYLRIFYAVVTSFSSGISFFLYFVTSRPLELFLVAFCCLASYSSICGLGGPKIYQFFLWCNLQWELSKQIPEQTKVSSMMPRVTILLLSFLISLRIMSTIISLPLLPKLFLIFTTQTTSCLFRNRKPNKLYPILAFSMLVSKICPQHGPKISSLVILSFQEMSAS